MLSAILSWWVGLIQNYTICSQHVCIYSGSNSGATLSTARIQGSKECNCIILSLYVYRRCYLHCSLPCIPYSGKFSRGPTFAEGQSSKISRSNFRRWPFQNFSTHNTWLTPPLTGCARGLEKLVRTSFLA